MRRYDEEQQMEESKNMSKAFRVYASHSAGSQFDKAEDGFPRKIIDDERWSRN